jgi:hypothetical protein
VAVISTSSISRGFARDVGLAGQWSDLDKLDHPGLDHPDSISRGSMSRGQLFPST